MSLKPVELACMGVACVFIGFAVGRASVPPPVVPVGPNYARKVTCGRPPVDGVPNIPCKCLVEYSNGAVIPAE